MLEELQLEKFVRDYNVEQLKVLSTNLESKLIKNINEVENFQEKYTKEQFLNFKGYVENRLNPQNLLRSDSKEIKYAKKSFEFFLEYLKKVKNYLTDYSSNILIELYFIESKNKQSYEGQRYLYEAERKAKNTFKHSLNANFNRQMANLLIINAQDNFDMAIRYLLKGVGYSKNSVDFLFEKTIIERKINKVLYEKMNLQTTILEEQFKIYRNLNYRLNHNVNTMPENKFDLQKELYISALIINLACYGLNVIIHKLNYDTFSDKINSEGVNVPETVKNNLEDLTKVVYREMQEHKTEFRKAIDEKILFLSKNLDSKNKLKFIFYDKIKKAFDFAVKRKNL